MKRARRQPEYASGAVKTGLIVAPSNPVDGAERDEPKAALLTDVLDIAERALWNPTKVPLPEIQKLAAAVVAHLRGRTFDGKAG